MQKSSLPKWIVTTALGCLLLTASNDAKAQTKILIHTEEDLPHLSYPVTGDLQQLIDMTPAQFTEFARPIRADIEKILRDYQIDDHAAHRKLLQSEVDLDIVAGDDAAALALIPQVRALEDKPGPKLMDDIDQEAFLKARMADGKTTAEGCPAGYQKQYQGAIQALPWSQAGEESKNAKSQDDLMTGPFINGYMHSTLDPTITKSHALSLHDAEFLIQGRAYAAVLVACRQPSMLVLADYIKAHDVAKPNIWIAREGVLPPADKLTPVNVGIWDSGFDTSLFPGRLFTQTATSADDAHGVAFDVLDHLTHGDLIPLTPQQAKDYPAMVAKIQGAGDVEAHIDSPAAAAFKEDMKKLPPDQMRAFFDQLSIIDGYAHGTHVAGISANGNPAIRLAYARITYDNANPHMPPTDVLLSDEVASYRASVQWFRDHKIRVVNMSWWDRPSNFEKDLADNGIGKDAAERKQLARHYFEIERDGLFAALQSAPEILFVTIAGNSDSDNAFEEDIPSSFRLPNLIVTGAVDQAGEETNFTTYGDNVLVDADGANVESVVPGGAKVRMSGTSMAAPQVTNLAAKLLAIDPKLTPVELISLIRDGSDASADGRRHLINPRRSIELLQERKGQGR